jgi:hypothetical protein
MHASQHPRSIGARLNLVLTHCMGEFELLECLSRQCESGADELVAEQLMHTAASFAKIALDAIAAFASVIRLPLTQGTTAASISNNQYDRTPPPPAPPRQACMAHASRRLLACTEELGVAVEELCVVHCKAASWNSEHEPVTDASAALEQLGIIGRRIQSSVDTMMKLWPVDNTFDGGIWLATLANENARPPAAWHDRDSSIASRLQDCLLNMEATARRAPVAAGHEFIGSDEAARLIACDETMPRTKTSGLFH